MKFFSAITAIMFFTLFPVSLSGQKSNSGTGKTAAVFKVVAFYTGLNDAAHVSYVHEANRWSQLWQKSIISFMILLITGKI